MVTGPTTLSADFDQGHNESLADAFSNATAWIALFPSPRMISPALEKALNNATLAIGIFGLLANLLFLFVWARVPFIRTVTNYFLLNLCFADLIYLISMTSYDILLHYVLPPHHRPSHPEVACVALHIFTVLPQYASIFTIALVSIERYVAICHPMRIKRFARKNVACVTIGLIWLIAMVFSVPTVLVCTIYKLEVFIASMIIQMTPFCLSLFTVCALYSMVIRQMKMRKSISTTENNIGKHFGTKITRDSQQVIVVLVVTSFVFFACVFPYHFKTIIEITMLASQFQKIPLSLQSLEILTRVCWMLLFVNSAVNPVVYKVFSSKHRSAFLQAFGFGGGKRHPTATHMMSRSSTTSTELSYSNNKSKVKMLSYTMNNGI